MLLEKTDTSRYAAMQDLFTTDLAGIGATKESSRVHGAQPKLSSGSCQREAKMFLAGFCVPR